MKHITLRDKINFIKKALKMTYYFFHLTSNNMILIVFENQKGQRFSYRGDTMFSAVIEAENYVLNEIKAGMIQNPEEEKGDEIDIDDTTENDDFEKVINQDDIDK